MIGAGQQKADKWSGGIKKAPAFTPGQGG